MGMDMGRLRAAISTYGSRYLNILVRLAGEADEGKRRRVRAIMEAALGTMASGKRVDEVVLDATNRFRFPFARAVLRALVQLGGEFSAEEKFLEAAVRSLMADVWDYFIVAEALGAKHLLIVLDAWKEDVSLLHKGRHAKDEKLIKDHDQAKLDSFMDQCASTIGRKGQQSAMKTDAEAISQVSAVVADLLHRTQSGHAMVRLILARTVEMLAPRFPSLTLETGECFEADFACLNSSHTFRNGRMVPRDADAGVAVMTLDTDLATQIPFGPGCCERAFLQVQISGGDVLIRRPQDLQARVLHEIAQTFAEDVPVTKLFLPSLGEESFKPSVDQQINMLLFLAPALHDYTLRVMESHFLKDASGFLPTEPWFQVLRAFAAICRNKEKQGEEADVSMPNVMWVARKAVISYFTSSPKKAQQRQRLIAALEDVENQKEMFYGALSRLVSMFPLRDDRARILPTFYSMWPRDRMRDLYQVVPDEWLCKASELDFPIRPIEAKNWAIASSFLTKYLRRDRPHKCKPKSATLLVMQWLRGVPWKRENDFYIHLFKLLGGIPGTWFSQKDWTKFFERRPSGPPTSLKWYRVDVKGSVGPDTANQAIRSKKKKRPNPKCDPAVTSFSGYFSKDGTLLTFAEANAKLLGLYSRVVREEQLRASLSGCSDVDGMERLSMEHGVPLFSVRNPQSEARSPYLVAVVAQAMSVGEPPLHHQGFTGNVLRQLQQYVNSQVDGLTVEWLSNDVMLQPKGCEEIRCPTCKTQVFPPGHWWHVPCDDCDCASCQAIAKCKTCASINQAFYKYGSLSRQWEVRVHKPSHTVSVGNLALKALVNSFAHLKHPGMVIGKETDAKHLADMRDAFWATFCHTAQSLVVSLCNRNECPMTPDNQETFYALVRAAEPKFPEVPSMERAIQMSKVLQAKKVQGNAGTRGLVAQGGVPKRLKASSSEQVVKEWINGPAVRRLIPGMMAIRNGSFAKSVFGTRLEQRELFAGLVLHRMEKMHRIQNHLRVIGMMAHLLRAAGATCGEQVRVFDRKLCKEFLMDLVRKDDLSAKELFNYGIVEELHAAFNVLRHFGHTHVFAAAEELQLHSLFKTLFATPLGDDMVTRLDVPAKSQVLSMLRMLFYIHTKGVSDSAFLCLYFAFSKSQDSIQDELNVVESDDDDDVGENVPPQANVDNAEAFLEDGFEPHDDELDQKPKKSCNELLLSHARDAWHKLRPSERSLVTAGGSELHNLLARIVHMEVFGNATGAFERYNEFRNNSSFGAKNNRAVLFDPVFRQGGASIGSVRAKLFQELLKHIPEHPGFRFAPLPQQSIALRLCSSYFVREKVKNFLVGPMSEAEKLKFPDLHFNGTSPFEVSLESLFDIGGFSFSDKKTAGKKGRISTVCFNGGSYLSAFSESQKKASATRLLKSRKQPVPLHELYASPEKRAEKQQEANAKAASRGASTHGGTRRIPVAEKRGCVTEKRFFDNLEKLHEKQEGAGDGVEPKNAKRERKEEGLDPAKAPNVFFSSCVENDSRPLPDADQQRVQFVVKLQSNQDCKRYAALLLDWLKSHPLVVLDPGERWVMRGIVARYLQGDIGENGEVSLSFAYRGVRVSGRKWNHYKEEIGVPEVGEQELRQFIQSALDRLAAKEVCACEPVAKIAEIFADTNFTPQVEQSCHELLNGRAAHRKESRLRHQQKIALNFARKISSLCEGLGDPIVIVGAAGGNGGHGRAQVNHDLMLKTLAGFFTVIMLDEHGTSKMTTCCHRVAHAPRSKGRSRGCKECCSDGRIHWWDRDTGAAWNMLSIFLSLLLTGERPAAMSKAASDDPVHRGAEKTSQ